MSDITENTELDETVFHVTDTLDLHGFYPEQIPEVVEEFIRHACELKLTQVKIIHGKGRSRLKFEVHQVLKQHPAVLNFSDAPPYSGGWGATFVTLNCKCDPD